MIYYDYSCLLSLKPFSGACRDLPPFQLTLLSYSRLTVHHDV